MIQQNDLLDVMPYEQKWVEGLNSGDVSVADQVFHQDATIHINGGPQKDLTLGEFKLMVSGIVTAFPDIRFSIEEQFAHGDKVSIRWTATGTHDGPLGDIEATGKRVQIDGLIIDHLQNGKVSERWEIWDQMAMLQQLGLM